MDSLFVTRKANDAGNGKTTSEKKTLNSSGPEKKHHPIDRILLSDSLRYSQSCSSTISPPSLASRVAINKINRGSFAKAQIYHSYAANYYNVQRHH